MLELSLLQAAQPQLSQLLFIGEVLLSSDHFCSPPLGSLQQLQVLPVLKISSSPPWPTQREQGEEIQHHLACRKQKDGGSSFQGASNKAVTDPHLRKGFQPAVLPQTSGMLHQLGDGWISRAVTHIPASLTTLLGSFLWFSMQCFTSSCWSRLRAPQYGHTNVERLGMLLKRARMSSDLRGGWIDSFQTNTAHVGL